MTVRVFPSKLNPEPAETHEHGACTVGQWLAANAPGYSGVGLQPISVAVEGTTLPFENWAHFEIKPTDQVDITVEAKGTELFFGALFAVVITAMRPKIPTVANAGQFGAGKGLNDASVKGNKVKLNSPIRDVAGLAKVFPDYLISPRKYFAGPREQRIELCTCIGKGDFDIPADKVLVGDTPVISLGTDATYQIYQPGADLSADPAALWWYTVTEVGSSSNGSAGLELTSATNLTQTYVASSQIASGFTVSIPTGAGSFPADWSTGLIVRIITPYNYEFVDGGIGLHDVVRGNALTMLSPSPGDLIEIAGSNAGTYVVNSFTPASGPTPAEMTLNFETGGAVTTLTPGTLPATIGPAGLRYRITVFSTSQITVDRLTSSGATDPTWPGFDLLQSTDIRVLLDESNLQGGFRGPFAACPVNELVTAIEWDVFFPQGLFSITREGSYYVAGSRHVFEYRDMDVAGAWTQVTKNCVGQSPDAQGFTFREDLPYPMRAEARIRRLPRTNSESRDTVVWYGFRGLMQGPTSYAGVTVATFNIRNGDRLSAQSESLLSAEVTRRLPVRSGGTWLPGTQATREIGPYVIAQLKAVGYEDSDIDLAEFDRLAPIWASRNQKYDRAVNETSTVKQLIADALAAGYCELTVRDGLLSPVIDDRRMVFEAMYSPQNMTENLERRFDAIRGDDFDGVDVEFINRRTWAAETVECRLPGDLGLKTQKITAEGVTDRTNAWRLGMRQRRAIAYRRWTYNWSTEMDALNSNYLSYVQVADGVPGYPQSARMTAYDPGLKRVRASEKFVWNSGANQWLYVRRPDGSSSGAYAVTRIDDFTLQLAQPLDFLPVLGDAQEPPHLIFGTGGGYAVLVNEIQPEGTDSVRLEAIAYDDRVYDDDENFPT